ncbi:MAG: nucleotidyltransferase family protein [Brevinema sp.]
MINIETKELAIVQRILAEYLQGEEIRVFGSRITEKTRPYSDLDLVIYSHQKLPYTLLAKMQEEFSDSDLPFPVDIIDINRASQGFRHIIDSHYEIFSY